MKKILIGVLHRPDRSPSQRFRFEQYLNYLKENGYEYEYSYLISPEDDKIFYGSGNYFGKLKILIKSIFKRWKEVRNARNFNIIFVQRECFMLGTAWFERRMAKKTKLIFDFDDAIWLHAVSDGNKSLSFLKDPAKTQRIIAASHLVFAGNDYLAAYALQFNKNVVIVPTTVDTDKFVKMPYPKDERICIGWSGSFSTIPHLETAMEALVIIKKKFGDKIYFKIIGDPNYKNDELEVRGIEWTSEDEVWQLSELDIGIMPLPDNEWTKGKCGLKGLTYMSLGIPTVMSPVGVNTKIIQNGVNGFLAATIEEWVERISDLVKDAELRKKLGDAGKQTVLDKYSVYSQRDQYLKYFDDLINS